MTRLYDRAVTAGSRPASVYDLTFGARTPDTVAATLRDRHAPDDPRYGTVDEYVRWTRATTSRDRLPAGFAPLDQAVLVIGDEVGHFLAGQRPGTDLLDLLGPVVPPFDHVFVDFRNVPNPSGCTDFGVLFTALPAAVPADTVTVTHPCDARWQIAATVYGSYDGRTVVGPLLSAQMLLGDDGQLLRHAGRPAITLTAGGDPDLAPLAPAAATPATRELLIAGLLTLSFLHAKNVDIVERPADAKRSRAHRRRHGRPLATRYVLDIGPLRRTFAAETGDPADVARAMHVCRGHLRTYTSERPLFGRHTGTFWVPAHPRGNRAAGTITKDYRVRAGNDDSTIGRAWADDNPDAVAADHPGGSNPDLSGRGWAAHARTVNTLAAHLHDHGLVPLRPTPDGAQFDAAWRDGDAWWVAEVKSLTDANEADQLRRGIGQVLDYRHAVADATGATVHAALILEREPAGRYLDVCAAAAITVAWPGALHRLHR